MARFSIGKAFGESFGLIGRRPLSVFVWGLLILLPSVAGVLVLLPVFAAAEMGTEPDFSQFIQFQGISGLLNLVQILLMVVVYTAVMRAVVRPKEAALFSLRLGMDELRVAVVGIAIGVGVFAAMIIVVMLAAAIGYAVLQLNSPGNSIAIAALVVVLLLGICLLMARISLIAPASVLYRDFAFVEGWKLGRGQAWPLFGMMVLLWLVVLLIEVAVVIAILAAVGLGSVATDPETFRTWVDPANWGDPIPWITANWPWCVAGGVVVTFVYGIFLTLGVAPYASACRQLVESSPAPAADMPPEPETTTEPANTPEL
tara:strand:- start:1802 stop:2746 length:945 start_codon:yes stop_codon:yes gene_type:complete